MSMTRILLQAQLTSIRNAGRRDLRMGFVVLVFDIAVGAWSGSQLIARISQWKAMGPAAVNAGLWSVCLLTWGGMIGITVLESLQQGLGNDTSLLLFTLPIQPATRFRALYGMFFLSRLWNWLLLETCITGVALVVTLGWQALSWLVLLQLGVGCVVYGGIVATLLFIRYVLPRGRMKTRIVASLMAGVVVGFTVVLTMLAASGTRYLTGQPPGTPLQVMVWAEKVVAFFADARLLVSALFLLVLMVALRPLARPAGKLYVAAFLIMQGWDRSRKAISIPGIRGLSQLLSRYRNLTGALFFKGLLNQSRNVMFWGRITIVLVALFLYPQVHNAVAPYRIPDTLFVIGYASGLALLSILEQAPNALSGEGNRLTLYLAAPFNLAGILRARLAVFLLPVLVEGLAIDLVLGWRLGLTEMGFAALAVILVIVACTALSVWGSIWDEDLSLAVEGTMQMLLQEEAAITPRRLALVNLSLLLFAALLLVIYKLPPIPALIVLMLLDGLGVTMMLRLSEAHVRRLTRRG